MRLINRHLQITSSILFGCLSFFLIVGPKALDPTNDRWLSHADPLQHYLGWSFFRFSNWSFPPGLNPNFGLDISSSIVFSDSIPLAAILFKPLNDLLPDIFQYFGLWLLLCFVLQAFFALQLMRLITKDMRIQILGIGFFIFFPPMLWRIGVHTALVSQFLILAALYLNLSQFNIKNISYWAILLGISASIHFYLFAIVLALYLPFFVNSLKTSFRIIPITFMLATLIGIIMYLCGYFSVETSASIGQGYGEFRFNPFSLLNPHGWSYLLKSNPQFNFDYEGYSYLGLGTISLIFTAIFTIIFKRWGPLIPSYIQRYRYLTLISLAFIVFALSNKLSIGQLNFYIPIPQSILDGANILRASSRLMWPVLYLGLFVALFIIVRTYATKISIGILGVCLLIQIVDTSSGWIPLRKKLMTTDWVIDVPFKNPIWKDFAQHYKKVVYMPLRCKQEQRGWADVARFAALYRLGTTSAYLARIDCTKAFSSNKKFESLNAQGIYDESTLYLFDSYKLDPERPQPLANRNNDLLARIDEILVLAPGFKKNSSYPPINHAGIVELDKINPSVKRNSKIYFNNESYGAQNFLLEGWGSPEDWGIWSIGQSSHLVIPLPIDPIKSLNINMRAFVTSKHPSQTFKIFIDQKLLRTITVNSARNNSISIALPADVLAKPYIYIDVESLNPESPNNAIDSSNDDRLLGFGLKFLQFQ